MEALKSKFAEFFNYKEEVYNIFTPIEVEDNYLIAFEIGYLQGDEVKNYALDKLNNVDVWVEQDLSNKDRFVFIKSQ